LVDLLAVQPRAITALQVSKVIAAGLSGDLRMEPRDRRILNADGRLRIATNPASLLAQLPALAGQRARLPPQRQRRIAWMRTRRGRHFTRLTQRVSVRWRKQRKAIAMNAELDDVTVLQRDQPANALRVAQRAVQAAAIKQVRPTAAPARLGVASGDE